MSHEKKSLLLKERSLGGHRPEYEAPETGRDGASWLVLVSAKALMITLVFAPHGLTAQTESQWARAKAVVGRMSLDEKIAQMHGIQDRQHYRMVPGLSRLGVPALKVTNGPAGVGPGGAGMQLRATALPAPISVAASWDIGLAWDYGKLAGSETKMLGSNLLEAPDVNLVRVPQSGRAFETYGEDPYLSSRLAVANVRGIQSTGVMANVKHFVANEQETDRGSINEIVPERSLQEIYLAPFEAAIKEGHAASVMCAYPRVNGSFNCENYRLLKDVLKGQWGFDGFVTSDFGAVQSTVASIQAGLDLELPTGIYFADRLKEAVENGTVPVGRIDDALIRRFAKMSVFGLQRPLQRSVPVPILQHGGRARYMAEQSMVLLKNSAGLLPLDSSGIKSISMIGPYAVRAMSGGSGSSKVIPFYTIDPFDGIAAHVLSQTPIDLLDGNDIAAAVASARKRQVAIIMVGDDEGEDHDHSIEIPEAQNRLVEAVAAVNPRTIVVLKSGTAMVLPWIDKVTAVLEAWYPGEEDGNAVANVLFGDVNPSGKLPITFPRSAQDTIARNPDQYPGDHTTVHYSEGLAIGYRWYQEKRIEPLFPFGYGLSYTTFQFSGLRIDSRPGASPVVRFRVTNTGKRDGAEVAQLYVEFPAIHEGNEPPLQLRGFKKVMLKPGASELIELTLNTRALSYWSESAHKWQIAKGSFVIHVGSSSEDLPLTGSLAVNSAFGDAE